MRNIVVGWFGKMLSCVCVCVCVESERKTKTERRRRSREREVAWVWQDVKSWWIYMKSMLSTIQCARNFF